DGSAITHDLPGIFVDEERQGYDLGTHLLRQLIAVIAAIGGQLPPKPAIPIYRIDQRTAGGVRLMDIDQRASDLAEEAILRLARGFSDALRILIRFQSH